MLGLDQKLVEEFRRAVVEWYRKHGDKDIPWRSSRNPWAVLIAAFLLRKTTTAQAAKVYGELLRRFPTPVHMASADVSELEELLRPLGMEHVRAQLLRRLAEDLVKRFGGRVPCSEEGLMSLPGVGRYIASEVLLAGCGVPKPLVDRNAVRLFERVFGVRSVKKRPMRTRRSGTSRRPSSRGFEEAFDLSYGIMDLARKVCTARSPRCGECPLKGMCSYFSTASVGKKRADA